MVVVGGLIIDGESTWIFGFTVKIGTSSGFMAELWRLQEGIKLVKVRGLRNVEVEMDVNAMVKAINNESRNDQESNVLLMDGRNYLMKLRYLPWPIP